MTEQVNTKVLMTVESRSSLLSNRHRTIVYYGAILCKSAAPAHCGLKAPRISPSTHSRPNVQRGNIKSLGGPDTEQRSSDGGGSTQPDLHERTLSKGEDARDVQPEDAPPEV